MILIELNNRKIPKLLFQIPNIIFIEADVKELHFSHDDTLMILLEIANKLVKNILVDNGSSVDLIFETNLQSIEWDLDNIQKVEIMNLVGFNGKTSRVIGKVTLSVETHSVAIY